MFLAALLTISCIGLSISCAALGAAIARRF